MKVFERCE